MTFPQRLCDGYLTFRSRRLPDEQSRYRDLAERGQAPETMVVGCCDSRVAPEVIFDVGPGELFVVRNVANLVPPYAPDGAYHGVSAAVEYAVEILGVKNIVVLGHARCGGIQAYADNVVVGEFIGRWISLIGPAASTIPPREQAPGSYLMRLELASLQRSLENLMTFPGVRAACESGRLTLYGAYFDVATGSLTTLDANSGRFVPVNGDYASGTSPNVVTREGEGG
jgi:carbonic anhydrase